MKSLLACQLYPIWNLFLCQVVAELKDLSEKLQLPYHGLAQQQPQQHAAQQIAPRATCLSVSPSGKWAAVAARNHVHVFDLEERKHHGRLPALEVRFKPWLRLPECPYLYAQAPIVLATGLL